MHFYSHVKIFYEVFRMAVDGVVLCPGFICHIYQPNNPDLAGYATDKFKIDLSASKAFFRQRLHWNNGKYTTNIRF